jgi:omega-amidase
MNAGKFTVAVAQMRFRPPVAANMRWITGVIRAAAGLGADAVLFPECATTGYNVDFRKIPAAAIEDACDEIRAAARAASCGVIVGCPTMLRNRRRNSVLVYDRRGREVFRYDKTHLTARDQKSFQRGNAVAFFRLNQVPCTAIICHERRYPELVRLPVMMGAQVIFHPNAGLDSLKVSRSKRHGRDGIAVRAFENQAFYVFANSVGPQGDGLWSAGDSKIVAPDGRMLALADHREEALLVATLDLAEAGRRYAREALHHPAFLRPFWRRMLAECRRRLAHAR